MDLLKDSIMEIIMARCRTCQPDENVQRGEKQFSLFSGFFIQNC